MVAVADRADFRPIEDDELPKSARTLAAEARAHGWKVCATYGRGVVGTLKGDVPAESIAVRLSGRGLLVACWVRREGDTGWGFAWGWCASRRLGYREVCDLVCQFGRGVA